MTKLVSNIIEYNMLVMFPICPRVELRKWLFVLIADVERAK